jgi:hypothetical protein
MSCPSGRGLASNIAHLLAQRAEQGWRVSSVNPCQAGDMWGAIVVLERERPARVGSAVV